MTYSLSALTITSVTVSSLASARAFAASHSGCGTRTDLAGVFGWFGMSAPCGGEHPVDRVDFGVGCTGFGDPFDGFVLVAGAVADGDGLAVGDLCAVGAGHGVHVCPCRLVYPHPTTVYGHPSRVEVMVIVGGLGRSLRHVSAGMPRPVQSCEVTVCADTQPTTS